MKGRCGYIDSTGAFCVPPRFEYGGRFSEGLAPVRIGGKWGYINTKGEMVIPARFEGAGIFHGGVARVSVECPAWLGGGYRGWVRFGRKGIGFIDRKGQYIVGWRAVAATDVRDGVAIFLSGGT